MLTNRCPVSAPCKPLLIKYFENALVFFCDSRIKMFLRGEIASRGRAANSPSFKFAAFLLKSFQMRAMDQSNCCKARAVSVAF